MAKINSTVMMALLPDEDYHKVMEATTELCSFINSNNQLPHKETNQDYARSLRKMVSAIFDHTCLKGLSRSDYRLEGCLIDGITEYLDKLEYGQNIDVHEVFGYGYRSLSMLALSETLKDRYERD